MRPKTTTFFFADLIPFFLLILRCGFPSSRDNYNPRSTTSLELHEEHFRPISLTRWTWTSNSNFP